MADACLIDIHQETVKSDWVDYNGHMNVAFYVLVFDHATDALLERIGLDDKHRETSGKSVFVAEAHLTYEKEVLEGNRVCVSTQILDVDEKRMHLFHRMYLSSPEYLISTNELMILSVDLAVRRVSPFSKKVMGNLLSIFKTHKSLPHPEQAGRIINIRKKIENPASNTFS